MKTCVDCKKHKELSRFSKQSALKDGHANQCKECAVRYQRVYRVEQKEMIRKQRRAYYLATREKRIAATVAWQKNNPGLVNAKNKAYKLSKIYRTPKWLTALQLDHIKMFYEAAAAFTKELGIKFEVDHIEPLHGKISSGLHVPWNLQVITKEENAKKSNKIKELR